jgi:hypothetical protein
VRIAPAVCFLAGLSVTVTSSVFAHSKRVSMYTADNVASTQKPLIGINAVSVEIAAKRKSSD